MQIIPRQFPSQTNLQVKCQLQALAKTLIGDYASHNKTSLIGWKEVRWNSLEVLGSMTEIFPCGKFVISFRNNIEQHYRSIKKHWRWMKMSLSQLIIRQDSLAQQFPAQHPSSTYKMALEDFSAAKFNHMLEWLGFKGCQYSTHACMDTRLPACLSQFTSCDAHSTPGSVIRVSHTLPWKPYILPHAVMAGLMRGSCVMSKHAQTETGSSPHAQQLDAK